MTPRPAPSTDPAALPEGLPADVAHAAHVAMHSIWATSSSPEPKGAACPDCTPLLPHIVAPLWKRLRETGTVPAWALRQAARVLHNDWSAVPLAVGDTTQCLECVDDLGVVLHALQTHAAAAPRRRRWVR